MTLYSFSNLNHLFCNEKGIKFNKIQQYSAQNRTYRAPTVVTLVRRYRTCVFGGTGTVDAVDGWCMYTYGTGIQYGTVR